MKSTLYGIYFVACCVAITFSHANELKWHPIEINKESSYLLDEQSVVRDGYSINAILTIRPGQKQVIKDQVFGSATYTFEAQCINKVIIPKYGALHEDIYAQSNAIEQNAISYYHKLVLVSVDQKLISFLCTN